MRNTRAAVVPLTVITNLAAAAGASDEDGMAAAARSRGAADIIAAAAGRDLIPDTGVDHTVAAAGHHIADHEAEVDTG